MIIVRLKAGLGNQLFQYATGRSLACFHNTALKLDLSSYRSDDFRQYALSRFRVEENIATDGDMADVKAVPSRSLGRMFYRVREALVPRFRRRVFEENELGVYDPSIRKTGPSVYLNGYWQSEKYFLDIREILLREFTLKEPPEEINRGLLEQIDDTLSVSVHVRRADYLIHAETAKRYLTCGIDYYRDAILRMTQKLRLKPHFFIFGDDMEWAKGNLPLSQNTTYVSHNQQKDYEDLRLIMACKHHIIANSSFSWWGAWLGNHPDKTVIAPKYYFKDRKLTMNDWYVPSWLRL